MEMPSSMPIKTTEKPPSGPAPVVGGPLSPLDLASKADSVVSQCSYSSTIVHVGDKKTQPESGADLTNNHETKCNYPELPVHRDFKMKCTFCFQCKDYIVCKLRVLVIL